MFTVYSDKDIFEEIVLFKDNTPNWHGILRNHSVVCLNITDDELDKELVPGTTMFEFVNAYGGRNPIALKDFFTAISNDPSLITGHPRAAFLLNVSKQDAQKLQDEFGVVVQSRDALDDKILKGTYYKSLLKDTVHENAGIIGWNLLLTNKIPPSNTVVITDPYLFTTDEQAGVSNLIALADTLLPADLKTEFHLLVITEEPDAKGKVWCAQKAGNIKAALGNLNRPYPINFEIVFAETIHKRIAVSNYYTLTLDKGFAVFKSVDNKTVRDDNELQLDRVFNRIELQEGDTEYDNARLVLEQLKKKCVSVAQYIANRPNDPNYRVMGDCKPDKSIINRLINDV
jgi:hypothetical protein